MSKKPLSKKIEIFEADTCWNEDQRYFEIEDVAEAVKRLKLAMRQSDLANIYIDEIFGDFK